MRAETFRISWGHACPPQRTFPQPHQSRWERNLSLSPRLNLSRRRSILFPGNSDPLNLAVSDLCNYYLKVPVFEMLALFGYASQMAEYESSHRIIISRWRSRSSSSLASSTLRPPSISKVLASIGVISFSRWSSRRLCCPLSPLPGAPDWLHRPRLRTHR